MTTGGKARAFEFVGHERLVADDTKPATDIFARVNVLSGGPAIDAATYAYDRLYRLTTTRSGPKVFPECWYAGHHESHARS